ncbi:S8 family serine peptidase [Kribbella sp. NPDC051620]|uniref:S8 family serine peptidase n=1 Tax=Kribbella sp. NPDC051620 TaxID=3364120 RepID=UPI0037B9085F
MSFRPAHLLRLGIPAALVAATLVAVTGSASNAAQPGPYTPKFTPHNATGPKYDPNSVVVKFKPSATKAARQSALSRFKSKTGDSLTSKAVELTGELPAPELLKKVKADPTVELASLNYRRHISAIPNDEYYGEDQSIFASTVRLPQAWDLSKSSGKAPIAVLDTGVDLGHPDLVGHLVPGYNFVTPGAAPVDDEGHGTMTLGLIAASANNAIGVSGVAWSAQAMPVKVLDNEGSGYDSDIIKGLHWAVAHGARVVNMSLGSDEDDPVLHDAIAQVVADGVVVVVAAGNDGNSVLQYPASYPEVIAVAATDPRGKLADFSSFGDWVDIAAPGTHLLSTGSRAKTDPDYLPYWYCTGTSCSAPVVTGIAAMIRNKWPAFTPAQIRQRLMVLSRDAGPRGFDQYYGAGIVDAYAALGGKTTTDFAGGAADGNDQPSRATKVGIGTTASSVISTEGDVDWYAIDSAAARNLRVSVTGASFDERNQNFANVGPEVDVYNADLQSLGHKVNAFPPVNPTTHVVSWGPLTASVDASAAAGTTYIAVRNNNGSWDSRSYSLSVTEAGSGGTSADPAYPIRDVTPAHLSSVATADTTPTVTFARAVAESTVTADTVRLKNGKTGATLPATISYDPATLKATLTPTTPLPEATAYKLVVDGVQETGGTPLTSIQTVFSTVDLVPPKLTTFTASGAYLAANVSWTIPAITDLDQVIIRQNVGGIAPTMSTGTLVYSGTGTSVKVTGLKAATTYTYAGWVKDKGGKYSPISSKAVNGVKSGISTTATAINYGGTITLKGSVLRIDNKAYAGLPVQLYGRAKNVAALKLITTLKTSSTGGVSYAIKPATSSVYTMVFVGNADLMGTRTADINIAVAPTVTSVLSPTAIRLGATTRFSGKVTPAHSGKLVYLQFYSARTWKNIASVKLSTTGTYAFGIKPTARGSFAYRVLFTADADHAQALSPQRIIKVS